MTLIVGTICKDAIVMGAESETTRGASKLHGTKKLTIVEFIGGSVIVGEAGIQFLSNAVVDRFSAIAGKTQMADRESVARTLSESFRAISKESIAPLLGTKKCQDYYRQETNYFELTMAFYADAKPYIYNFNPVWGLASKCPRNFSVSGIGKDLSEYLLKDIPFEEMDSRAATLEIANVVREVKTSVSGCGGNTEIALVSNGSKPEKLNHSALSIMEQKILFLSEKYRSERRRSIEESKKTLLFGYQSGSDEQTVGPVKDE